MDLRTLKFGIEIETVGLSCAAAAEIIHDTVGGQRRSRCEVQTPFGIWKAVYDGSLRRERGEAAEIVSPPLPYSEIPTVQNVVRALRAGSAGINNTCGIHVHVGIGALPPCVIANLAKIVCKYEALIQNALQISEGRRQNYCQSVDNEFMRRLLGRRIETYSQISRAWYADGHPPGHNSGIHYHRSRYHGLNLHSVWYRGTVEFRWFNGTLHAGKIKAYIQFCLALMAKAASINSASAKKRAYNRASAKFDFRVFLVGLGMKGGEFKTARHHLLSHLSGNSAWKNGQPIRPVAGGGMR